MLRRVIAAWDDAQVELHGRYSAQRMRAFDAYARQTGVIRFVIPVLLTPLPCLAVVALADSIPLEPIERGLAHSHGLWVRYLFAVWIYSVCGIEQLRQFIPGLPISTLFEAVVPVVSSVLSIAITFGLTLVIGFPLPFTIQLTCIPWGMTLTLIIWYSLRTHIQQNPRVVRKLLQFLVVMSCEISLAIIYPAYNAAFVKLSGGAQTAFTLLLPFIKLFEKNLIGFALSGVNDLKPEIIVFNVEIFNALFVACCMQNSKSFGTNIVLMAVDFIQACIGLRDLDSMLAENAEYTKRLGLRQDELVDAAIAIVGTNAGSERLMDLEVQSERQRRSQRRSERASLHLNSSNLSQVVSLFAPRGKQTVSVAPAPPQVSCRLPDEDDARTMAVPGDDAPLGPSLVHHCHAVVPDSVARRKLPIQSLTAKEQRLFLLKTLQILHLVEFLLLIEFTEVMIPVVYSLYLMVLFELPNRAFYPQLKDMDMQHVRATILTVMMNATLELISLLILSYVLWKKLRISAPKQLAFVLKTQFRDVQSKMILWTIVSLQCSLVHLGADYTFRFEWLRTK